MTPSDGEGHAGHAHRAQALVQEEPRQQGRADGVQGGEHDDHGQLAQVAGHDEEEVARRSHRRRPASR